MDRSERDFAGMVEAKRFANGLGMRIKGKKRMTSGSSVFGLIIHGHSCVIFREKEPGLERGRKGG